MEEESNEDYESDVRKRMFFDEGSTRRIVVRTNTTMKRNRKMRTVTMGKCY